MARRACSDVPHEPRIAATIAGPSLLSRRRRWLTYLTLGGLWTTGAVWLVLRYGFSEPASSA